MTKVSLAGIAIPRRPAIVDPLDPMRVHDPQHWRDRAEEARTKAEQMRSLHAAAMMIRLSEQYDLMAEQAERAASVKRQ